VVTEAEIVIDNDVILDGGGKLTVDGNRDHRVFTVSEGVTAELDGFAVTRGSVTGIEYGGGVHNSGTLILTNSDASGNTAWAGGGIDSSGTLILTNSNVWGNSARHAGGISNRGVLTLTNSDVSGNAADSSGGGISLGANQPVLLMNSTVSGNSAGREGGGIACWAGGSLVLVNSNVSRNSAGYDGGGIYGYRCTVTLTNSTVSSNDGAGITTHYFDQVILMNSTVSSNSGGAIVQKSKGAVVESRATLIDGDCIAAAEPGAEVTWVSHGYNIESPGNACGFDQATDQVDVSASALNLGPLQDNGGPTETHALLPGSVAIDVIPADMCEVDEDQRGFPRDSMCDVGAIEVQP
jgi:hypothetical protein